MKPKAANFCALFLFLSIASLSYSDETIRILYSFHNTHNGPPFPAPVGLLAADRSGNLYGVQQSGGAYDKGTVYELTKDLRGNWVQVILHSFTGDADGETPSAGVTLDDEGHIYGTAQDGRVNGKSFCGESVGCGVVFELRKINGEWQFTVLHTFIGYQDGVVPAATLTLHEGRIYGTTQWGGGIGGDWGEGCGTVFELSPSNLAASTWNEQVIYRFLCGGTAPVLPVSNVVFDAHGNLFSVTRFGGTGGGDGGCGAAFELSPPQPRIYNLEWNYQDVYDFVCGGDDAQIPIGNLVIDQAGSLYGVTEVGGTGTSCLAVSFFGRCGTVFRITPAATDNSWQESVIYNFQGREDGSSPMTGITMAPDGELFGTTTSGPRYAVGCGSVFALVQDTEGPWSIDILHPASSRSATCVAPASAVLPYQAEILGLTDSGGAFQEGVVYAMPIPKPGH
jgi:hypothetical protein